MHTAIQTNSLKAWFLACRPKTLGAISCPILLGNAVAAHHGQFSWNYCAMMLINGLVLQILANIVNDYGDFVKGSDGEDRLGPPRAMQMGWITKPAMHAGIGVTLLVCIALGMYLVYVAGFIVLLLGIIAIALCLAYTLGPLPIAYFGFAEVVVFIVFGPIIVVGSYFVQTQTATMEAVVASLTPACLAAALLLTNNLRDLVQDRRNNKRTIAVRFGDELARKLIVFLVVASLAGPFMLLLLFDYPPAILLACLALVLPIRSLSIIYYEPISAKFNLMLASIGTSLYLFGLLFSIGLFYGAN